jgi:hypothetical protein
MKDGDSLMAVYKLAKEHGQSGFVSLLKPYLEPHLQSAQATTVQGILLCGQLSVLI